MATDLNRLMSTEFLKDLFSDEQDLAVTKVSGVVSEGSSSSPQELVFLNGVSVYRIVFQVDGQYRRDQQNTFRLHKTINFMFRTPEQNSRSHWIQLVQF